MAKESMIFKLAGREVAVSSPSKEYFPSNGETKLDLINYYIAVAEPMLNVVGGRPVLLQRFPNGVKGTSFYQKRVPDSRPDWLQTTTVSTVNGTDSQALVLADIAHVVWAVNLGCLGFHIWPYLSDTPQFHDTMRIDLDPTPGTTFSDVQFAALKTKELLDEHGLTSFVKTTGSKGLHILVRLLPKYDSYQVRQAVISLARELARRHPKEITSKWWKEERGKKIFVDYNQNCPHKNLFGAYSVRARVGAQVSTPISWDEVEKVKPDSFTIKTVQKRVEKFGKASGKKGNMEGPWADINLEASSIDELIEAYETDLKNGILDEPWPPVYPKQPNEPPRVAPSRAKKEE